jgi:hypothetical protein
MNMKLGALAVGVGLFCTTVPVFAHHSFEVEYNRDKPIEVTGVVMKVAWTNPHMRVYIDVTDADGKVTTWNFELASPNTIVRNGWTRNDLKPGDKVVVRGFAGRVVETRAILNRITTAEGRRLLSPGGPGAPDTAGP